MFAQVFQAKVRDPELWAEQSETWRREIRPKTTAFLGFTAGITDDREMITVARFESEAGARRDSDLPEQGAWFEELAKNFETPVTFHDCREVDTMLGGGSNDAGFVQVMQGRAKNESEMRARSREFEPQLRQLRPDLLGITIAWHGDGDFTQVAYFTSEAEARRNEQQMSDDPLAAEFMSLIDGDMTYFDLSHPEFEERPAG